MKSTIYDNLNCKKSNMIANKPNEHIPNKNEGEALRKIMAKTHMTEEEVRSVKKYRKILADASKEGVIGKRTKTERYYYGLIKDACKFTGLAKEHPQTLAKIDELVNNRTWGTPWFLFSSNIPSAKHIVENYRNK